MVDYAGRLKAAMDARGVTVAQLANGIGASYQGVKRVLDGLSKAFSAANNTKAASFLSVSPDWLATGEGAMDLGDRPRGFAVDLEDNPDFLPIRFYRDWRISAGASGFALEYADGGGDPIVFQKQWYERHGFRPGKLFAVRVGNASMEPGLCHDDVVVVNTDQQNPKDGVVFAVDYEGEMVIKRLVRDSGQWWLTSDNPDQTRYPRKLCDAHCRLLGEVVHKQSQRI